MTCSFDKFFCLSSMTKKIFMQGYSKFVKVIQAIKCSLPFPKIFTLCKQEMTIQMKTKVEIFFRKRKSEEMSSPEKVSKSIQAGS